MNLFTKVVYGSSGYTRTFQLIIKQSPLIELFRKVHTLFQDNFHLVHRSVRHAPPDTASTLKVLLDELKKSDVHAFKPERRAEVKLEDHLREGMYILQTSTRIMRGAEAEDAAGDEDTNDDEDEDMELDIDDLEAAE